MIYVGVAVVGLALLAATLFARRRTKRLPEWRIALGILVIAAAILLEWLAYDLHDMANYDGYELKIYDH